MSSLIEYITNVSRPLTRAAATEATSDLANGPVVILIEGGHDSDVDSRNAFIRASLMNLLGFGPAADYPDEETAIKRAINHLREEHKAGNLLLDIQLNDD